MFSYEFLKLFHLCAVLVFVGMATAHFIIGNSRLVKIVFYASSLAVIAGGFGLIGVLGQGFTTWMLAKLGVWIVLMAAAGILAKRFPNMRFSAAVFFLVICSFAVYLAVYKPEF